MGMYIYLTEEERLSKKIVLDTGVNDALQDALKYDNSILIEQTRKLVKKGLFNKAIVDIFHVYHEAPAHDGSTYQARYQFSASGEKNTVIAYLHGIINGCSHFKLTTKNNQS